MSRSGTVPIKVWNPAPRRGKKKKAMATKKRKKARKNPPAKKRRTKRRAHKANPAPRRRRRRARARAANPGRRTHRRHAKKNPARRRRSSHRRTKKNPGFSWGIVLGPIAGLAALAIGRGVVPHFVTDATNIRYVNGALMAGGVGLGFVSPAIGACVAAGFGAAAVGDLAVVKVASLFGPAVTPPAGKIGDPFQFNGGPGFDRAPQLPAAFDTGDSDEMLEGLVLQGIHAELGGIEGLTY